MWSLKTSVRDVVTTRRKLALGDGTRGGLAPLGLPNRAMPQGPTGQGANEPRNKIMYYDILDLYSHSILE